jgi:hypothetical protein
MILKRVGSVLLLCYALWLVLFYRYHFVDGANLLIHEAGHMVFMPFGQTLHMVGGTFWQLVAPLAAACYFLWQRNPYAAAAMGLWFGESLMYTAVYMGDAMAMELPLVGGGIHDWNWLLYRVGLLGQCRTLAFAVHTVASLVVLASSGWMLYVSWLGRTRPGLTPHHVTRPAHVSLPMERAHEEGRSQTVLHP